MVRAILDGRKTQTRRVVKRDEVTKAGIRGIMGGTGPAFISKYQKGMRLWVRETFNAKDGIKYRASTQSSWRWLWKPSIFMPKKYARIWLEVLDVRVERVQEISTSDCIKEGFLLPDKPFGRPDEVLPHFWFEDRWNSLNAKRGYGWDKNPWVWVIEFRRIK